MGYEEARSWFDEHVGRSVKVILYVADMPIADLDGELEIGVKQDRADSVRTANIPPEPESGELIAYQIGSGVLGLAEELVVSTEHIGSAIAVQLIDGVEILAHAWRDGEETNRSHG
jgi:hypothetical protein